MNPTQPDELGRVQTKNVNCQGSTLCIYAGLDLDVKRMLKSRGLVKFSSGLVTTLLDLVGLRQKTESRPTLEHVFCTDFTGKGSVRYLHANQRCKILIKRIFICRLKHLAGIQNLS